MPNNEKKTLFFIKYGDAYMPNSEKKRYFLIEYGDA